ncbi:unnamed protein product [Caenorhabditis brenneri]
MINASLAQEDEDLEPEDGDSGAQNDFLLQGRQEDQETSKPGSRYQNLVSDDQEPQEDIEPEDDHQAQEPGIENDDHGHQEDQDHVSEDQEKGLGTHVEELQVSKNYGFQTVPLQVFFKPIHTEVSFRSEINNDYDGGERQKLVWPQRTAKKKLSISIHVQLSPNDSKQKIVVIYAFFTHPTTLKPCKILLHYAVTKNAKE